jgi:hypothetical protein
MKKSQLFFIFTLFISNITSQAKMNQNKVTDFFENNIEERDEYLQNLDSIRNKNIEDIKQGANISNSSEKENRHEIKRLNSIKAAELDKAGDMVRNSTQYDFYKKGFEVDSNTAGIAQHKKDIKKISNATRKLLKHLTKQLDKLGINCKPNHDQKLMKPRDREVVENNVRYDSILCEELKNEYQCQEYLQVKCIDRELQDLTAQYFSSNLPLRNNNIDKTVIIGWDNQQKILGDRGKIFDYILNFNIDDIDQLIELRLISVGFDDHLLINLNNRQIFMGPLPGNKIEIISDYIFGKYHLISIDNSNKFYSIEGNKWHFKAVNLDIKRYLNAQSNQMNIRLGVGGYGGIRLILKGKISKCIKWEENRQEICTLK